MAIDRVVDRWRDWIDALILRSTARRWHRRIVRVLCRAHATHLISSRQVHLLIRAFDPTQDSPAGQWPHLVRPRPVPTVRSGVRVHRDTRTP